MQSNDEDDLPIDVEENDSSPATADGPKPPTENPGGHEVLEAAPPSLDPQHALLRPHVELPSGEAGPGAAVQGWGRSTQAIVFGTDSHENPPPARPEPEWGAVNEPTPPDSRYGNDPPEGAGEADGAVGGAGCPPSSFMPRASSLGMNQTFGEVLARVGFELREDAAEQPIDDEFVDIIRELDEESDDTLDEVLASLGIELRKDAAERSVEMAPATGLGDRSHGAAEERMAGARDVNIHGRDIGVEPEDMTDHEKCGACGYNGREVILIPCGHRDFCRACFLKYIAQVRPVRCPRCKLKCKCHEFF